MLSDCFILLCLVDAVAASPVTSVVAGQHPQKVNSVCGLFSLFWPSWPTACYCNIKDPRGCLSILNPKGPVIWVKGGNNATHQHTLIIYISVFITDPAAVALCVVINIHFLRK